MSMKRAAGRRAAKIRAKAAHRAPSSLSENHESGNTAAVGELSNTLRAGPRLAAGPGAGDRIRKGKNTVQILKSTYTRLVTLCLLGLLGQEAGAQTPERGVMESPAAFVSGIGFISGWKCNTHDIELWLMSQSGAREGVLKLNPAQNMPRSDTAGVCLGEENNGWIIQVNWNELIGYDRVVARDNGEAFASRSFTIGHTGLPFINDKGGTEVEVVDFPSSDKATTLTWSTATQHFEVSGTEDIAPCTGDACEGSGEGVGSREGSEEGGIICEGNNEEVTITCEYRESLPPAVDSFLDDDGCFRAWVQFQHPGTNWYLVREWSIVYGFGPSWRRRRPSEYIRPVADDIPGTWNQQRYREIPFDDQAFYHLQRSPNPVIKAGTSVNLPPDVDVYNYTQFQFYALGPLSADEEGKHCFREIPPVPAP